MFARTRDGRALQYKVTESSVGPIVVFESGLGGAHTQWALVQPAVAEFARTVVYNRAGYGLSDPATGSPNLDRMADDLADLLDTVSARHAEADRFVLVGHSLGGLIAQVLAARAPSRVRGLVLVDTTALDISALHTRGYATLLRVYDIALHTLSATGLLRWYTGRLAERMLPPAYAAEVKKYELTPSAVRARGAESHGWLATLAERDPEPVHIPAVPVSVLTATRAPRFAGNTHRQVGASHRRLAESADQGRHIHIDAGHNIHLTEPEAVVEAIKRVVENASNEQH